MRVSQVWNMSPYADAAVVYELHYYRHPSFVATNPLIFLFPTEMMNLDLA